MKAFSFRKILPLVFGVFLLGGCDASTDTPYQELVVAQADVDAQAAADNVQDGLTAAQTTARNFYVVFDGSGSMDEAPPERGQFTRKIDGAKWALHQFVDGLPADVNLGLYVFDNGGAREVLPLSPNSKVEFLRRVDAVDANNGTPLGASIEAAVKALKAQYLKQYGYGEYRLVVVTDGHSSDSITKGVRAAAQNNFTLYTIGFGIGETHELRQYSRFYQNADSAEKLKEALGKAGSELELYDPTSFPAGAKGK